MTNTTEQAAELPRMLSRADVSRLLGVGDNTLRSMIKAGKFPAPVTLPGGSHRYLESEVRDFQARLIGQRDTAAAGR